jgi:hypothetical protein
MTNFSIRFSRTGKLTGMLFFLFLLTGPCLLHAQVSNYIFTQSNNTYTPITGGTLVGQATDALPTSTPESAPMDDFTYTGISLPFTFTYNGTPYTSININTNGWLSFDATAIASTSSPISSSTHPNAVCAFGRDLMGLYATSGDRTSGSNVISNVPNTSLCAVGAAIQGAGIPTGTTITSFTANSITLSAAATASSTGTYLSFTTGTIRTEATGSAPNRIFVVQFKGMSQYSSSLSATTNNTSCEFQIRLYEGGGVPSAQKVDVIYGTLFRAGGTQTGQVGLKGLTTSDYNNRSSATDWAATIAGTANSATITWSSTINPASGLTFTWTPPTCPAPTALTATNITINSADLGWTGTAPQYSIEWGPAGFTPGTGTFVTTSLNPYPLGSLTPSTAYQFYVRKLCVPGSDSSFRAGPFSFSTNCNPPVTTGTGGSRCGPGTVSLTASSSQPGATINWYTAASGGTAIGNGSPFVTPSISATTTYYAASANGAPENLSAPTIGSSEFFTASTGWGIRFTANQPAVIDSVTVKARHSTTPGPATMQILITDLTDAVIYSGITHNFSVTSTATEYRIPVNVAVSPGDYKMVMTSTGINQLVRESSGVTFPYTGPSGAISITAGANGTGTAQTTSAYYWFYNWRITTGCEGARVPVIATVNAGPAATGTGASRCGPGTLTLTASSATSGATFNWYTAATGGSPVGTGASYTTPSITATTTYYVAAVNSGCEGDRVPVTATVNAGPVATGTGASRCGPGTLTLNASSATSGVTFNWYTTAAGGSPIATASTYTTPSLAATTTYYVSAVNSGCEGDRVPVTATINPLPQISGTGASRCGTGTVTLTASSTTSGATFNWYTAAIGGSPVATGASYSTPSISTTTTYYVASVSGSCESARQAVTATVNVLPAVSLGNDTAICPGGTLVLDATASGVTYLWDDASTGATRSVGAAGTYHVTITDANSCTGSDTITVGVNTLPVVNLGADTAICDGAVVTLDAGNAGGSYLWDDASTAQTRDINTDGSYSVVVTDANGCSNSDTIAIALIPAPSGSIVITPVGEGTYSFSIGSPQNVTSAGWNFGDGQTGTGTSVQHTYTANGDYIVTLVLHGQCDDSIVLTQTVKVEHATGIDNLGAHEQLVLHPNPAKGKLQITAGANSLVLLDFEAYNVLGQRIYKQRSLSSSRHEVGVQGWAQGWYTLKIRTNKGTAIRKFEVLP